MLYRSRQRGFLELDLLIVSPVGSKGMLGAGCCSGEQPCRRCFANELSKPTHASPATQEYCGLHF